MRLIRQPPYSVSYIVFARSATYSVKINSAYRRDALLSFRCSQQSERIIYRQHIKCRCTCRAHSPYALIYFKHVQRTAVKSKHCIPSERGVGIGRAASVSLYHDKPPQNIYIIIEHLFDIVNRQRLKNRICAQNAKIYVNILTILKICDIILVQTISGIIYIAQQKIRRLNR